jgi:hypothetical protein
MQRKLPKPSGPGFLKFALRYLGLCRLGSARKNKAGEGRQGNVPVLEPFSDLLDLTLVAADVLNTTRSVLGRPELREVFAVSLCVQSFALTVEYGEKESRRT